MKERRKFQRLDEENDVTISVIANKNNIHKDNILNNCIKNISVAGTKLQTKILLPGNTLLNMSFTLKTLKQKITAVGKVKWFKDIIGSDYYEVGVEFVSIPVYSRHIIEEYILWKKSIN